MIEFFLLFLLGFAILILLFESYFHNEAIKKLPIRIHVNGSRGKSSVTRLIAAGLRAGGYKTLAKTTGTSPRIIDEFGNDMIIHRLRSAPIGEQVRLLINFVKKKPNAVVIECMAVNPQYQWIAEHKMIKSTIGVITNVRPDHLDEMGSTLEDNAKSLFNTIPFNGKIVTIQDCNKNTINDIFIDISKQRSTDVFYAKPSAISDETMNKFKYLEHKDNVAIALKVCELSGIDKKIAINGMFNAKPDPGATVIWQFTYKKSTNYFINLLAANDPDSTFNIFSQIQNRIGNKSICIFLNTREDRQYRTIQLVDLVFKKIKPQKLLVRGENLPDKLEIYKKDNKEINVKEVPYDILPKDLFEEISQLNNYYIVGIGNIVGWGENLIKELKKIKHD